MAEPLGAGTTTVVTIANACGIPTTTRSVALNVTVTSPTSAGFLAIDAADALVPHTSTLNYGTGQTRGSNAVVNLGVDGRVNVFVGQKSGGAHVILDVAGYFE